MNDDLIERLLREAGLSNDTFACGLWFDDAGDGGASFAALQRFAAMVAEECAKVAEETYEAEAQGERVYGEESAKAIRAMFKAPKNG